MRVRVFQHSEDSPVMRWWYWDQLGKEFEVWEDPQRDKYYYTKRNSGDGIERDHHILKVDCEPVNQ